jgi:hypothetical protein
VNNDQLAQRIADLEDQCAMTLEQLHDADRVVSKRIEELERQNAELREALCYYTTAQCIDTHPDAKEGDTKDDGHIAREALSSAQQQTGGACNAESCNGECGGDGGMGG